MSTKWLQDKHFPTITWEKYDPNVYPQDYPNKFHHDGVTIFISKGGFWSFNGKTYLGDPTIDKFGKLVGCEIKPDGATVDDSSFYVQPVEMARVSRSENKQTTPCRFFAQGNCKNGDACKFVHDERKLTPCRFFAQGKCKNGNACEFNHDERKRTTCRYYTHGKCTKGNACEYSHK